MNRNPSQLMNNEWINRSIHPFIPSSLHPFIPSSPHHQILYYSSSYTYTFPSHPKPLGGSASHVGQCQPCVQQQRNCWGGGTWRFEDCPGGTVGGCRDSIAMSLFTVPVFFFEYFCDLFFCPGHFSCDRLLFVACSSDVSTFEKKQLEVGDRSLEASMLCISSEVNMVPRPGLMDQWVDGFDGLTVDVLYGPSVVWHLFFPAFFFGGGGWGKTYDFNANMGVGFPGYATVTQADELHG